MLCITMKVYALSMRTPQNSPQCMQICLYGYLLFLLVTSFPGNLIDSTY